ncbi:hypothetical protein P872_04735 [Rhodonellum psychrophilum GCM71 = DSM 17998]|uniref:Uncharacterized protein n=1 Tax=Rhodonellum psychrophilum GCM71 = DSM 17998 TaxID=1123057 RepID=U5BXL6_9BACT|nr:hypothetical protein P872_04735 [Rhodonellum psychrophilum GCM71 = DSM 17998]
MIIKAGNLSSSKIDKKNTKSQTVLDRFDHQGFF